MPRLQSFWRNLLRRDRVERDLDDELRATLELLVDEKVHGGMPPAAARRAARAELGAVEAIKDQVRDARTGAFLETLLQDLRYGARLLRRNPLFTLTATLSLAIGIGATTTIFTVANGLLLRSAPGVADPASLVDVVRQQRGDIGVDEISYPDYLDVRRRATTLEQVYGYKLQLDSVSLRVTGSAERVFANVVTTNYFDALGVRPAVGRMFGAVDGEEPGTTPVIVLSHRFWTRRFNGDPGIAGRTVHVNSVPFIVAGVADEQFRGTSVVAPDAWVPAGMLTALNPENAWFLTNRHSDWLLLGARLKPGVSHAQASAEVRGIGEALAREFPIPPALLQASGMPDLSFDWSVENASPIPAGMRTVVATFLVFLMAIVSVVLLIACANVAGILLARGTVRRRELAVRTAIGAGRARVVRQLLTETLLLLAAGGIVGLAIARVMTSLLLLLLPALPVPAMVSVPLDGRVVAFSTALSCLAALLAGLAPALHAAKSDVVHALKDDSSAPVDRLWLRNSFVVAQVAFSTLLVIVAALLTRGFDRVSSIDRGFDPRGVDVVSVDLSMAGYTSERGSSFAQELIERIRAVPGIETATLASRAPGPGTMSFGGITVPGATPPNGQPFFYADWAFVDSGYFSTLRIPFVAGRDFTSVDRQGGEPVAIVGEGAARRFWPGKDAVGQFIRIRTGDPLASAPVSSTSVRVVGVVRDIRAGRRGPDGPNALYIPIQQRYVPQLTILARRSGSSLAAPLRAVVTSTNPDLPVLTAQTLEMQQDGPVQSQLRIGAAVAGSVGIIGLALAAVGVYGVTAYTVARRTREIGIRLSLGANRLDILQLVLRQSMRLVGIGSGIGVLMGGVAGLVLSGPPFEVPPPDAPLLVGAAALFGVIGLVACYLPVRHATRIRAMQALRAE